MKLYQAMELCEAFAEDLGVDFIKTSEKGRIGFKKESVYISCDSASKGNRFKFPGGLRRASKKHLFVTYGQDDWIDALKDLAFWVLHLQSVEGELTIKKKRRKKKFRYVLYCRAPKPSSLLESDHICHDPSVIYDDYNASHTIILTHDMLNEALSRYDSL